MKDIKVIQEGTIQLSNSYAQVDKDFEEKLQYPFKQIFEMSNKKINFLENKN